MRISVICEGKTETAFKPHLNEFLKTRLAGKMPSLVFDRHDGAIPTDKKLQRVVINLLENRRNPSDAVIGLTDVYPKFSSADEAKRLMREWVGADPRFYPHVALHDFEAWLLPYWDRVQKLASSNIAPFGLEPEKINNGNPPAHRLKRVFEAGKCRDSYSKPRDAGRILRDADLMVSINACSELKAFVNTILKLCGKQELA